MRNKQVKMGGGSNQQHHICKEGYFKCMYVCLRRRGGQKLVIKCGCTKWMALQQHNSFDEISPVETDIDDRH